MGNAGKHVQKFTSDGLKIWMTDEDQKILFEDVVDQSEGARLDETFVRWSAGENGEFDYPLPYDEVLVVIKGSYTVRTG